MNERSLYGIRIRVHVLFWAVVGLSVAAGYFVETITLFAIVLIHELGHVAAARELNWHVTQIQLLPFGGVATIEEEVAADPVDEMMVALAGPFMNVLMAAAGLLFWQTGWWTEEWTRFFVNSNLLIAGFNLIPLWPLDGGRILQALLCCLLPYRTAVLISLGLGCVLSAALLCIGLMWTHPNLIAVASYLLAISSQAYLRFPYQFIRFLAGKYARESVPKAVRSIPVEPELTAFAACRKLRKNAYHLFSVRGSSGLLDEDRLLHAILFENKHHIPIGCLL